MAMETVLVKVSIAEKRHDNRGNSYKGQTCNWCGLYLQVMVACTIIIMVQHGDVQADMVLEK